MNTCESMNCPFIAYCRKYDAKRKIEGTICVYAEQLFFRAKMYEKQVTEKDMSNGRVI